MIPSPPPWRGQEKVTPPHPRFGGDFSSVDLIVNVSETPPERGLYGSHLWLVILPALLPSLSRLLVLLTLLAVGRGSLLAALWRRAR